MGTGLCFGGHVRIEIRVGQEDHLCRCQWHSLQREGFVLNLPEGTLTITGGTWTRDRGGVFSFTEAIINGVAVSGRIEHGTVYFVSPSPEVMRILCTLLGEDTATERYGADGIRGVEKR